MAIEQILEGNLSRSIDDMAVGKLQQAVRGFRLGASALATGFDSHAWAKRLADRMSLELLNAHRKVGLDTLRAFAIDCYPWHGNVLCISFLTDREWPDYDPEKHKWDIASWRLYAFTSAPHSQWPYGEEVLREAQQYYDGADSSEEAAKRRDEILRACIEVANSHAVQKELQRFKRSADFEIFVGHPDARERNFYREWGAAPKT